MVDPTLKNLSIESANFMLMLAAIVAFYRVVVWKVKNHLSTFVSEVVCCWAWVFGAIGLRAGWFAFARHLAEEGSTWNQTMYEFRFLAINITALACIWGLFRFIQLIDEFSNCTLFGLLFGTFVASRLLGYY